MAKHLATTWWLIIFSLVLLITLLGIYYPLLAAPNFFLEFDDPQLLNPLAKISSWADYGQAKASLSIVDQAPLRDLSFWLDLHGKLNFHIHNFVIWIIILFIYYFTLRQLRIESYYALAATALLGLHPASVSAVAWIAARKHLLSMAFILLATFSLLKALALPASRRSKTLYLSSVLIFYLLANLAWPINVLWPLMALLISKIAPHLLGIRFRLANYPGTEFKNYLPPSKIFLLSLCAIMLGLMAVNFYYYQFTYLSQTQGNAKFVTDLAGYGMFVLALGRHVFQIIFPFWPCPTPLDISPAMAASGLIALVGLFYILRKINAAAKLLALAWISLNLILVSISTTNIFASDTYLLMPLAGFFYFLAWGMQTCLKRKSIYLLLILLSLYSVIAKNYVPTWQNNLSLWTTALARDDHPHIIWSYAQYIFQANPETAYPTLVQFFKKHPHPDQSRTIAKAIATSKDFSLKQKMDLLAQEKVWGKYFQSGLAAQHADWPQAYHYWLAILQDENALKELTAWPQDLAIMAAEGNYFCQQSGHAPSFCQQQVNYVRKIVPDFAEKDFLQRQQELAK